MPHTPVFCVTATFLDQFFQNRAVFQETLLYFTFKTFPKHSCRISFYDRNFLRATRRQTIYFMKTVHYLLSPGDETQLAELCPGANPLSLNDWNETDSLNFTSFPHSKPSPDHTETEGGSGCESSIGHRGGAEHAQVLGFIPSTKTSDQGKWNNRKDYRILGGRMHRAFCIILKSMIYIHVN